MIGESSILDLKVLLDIKLVEESKLHIILLGQMQLIRCGLESLMCVFLLDGQQQPIGKLFVNYLQNKVNLLKNALNCLPHRLHGDKVQVEVFFKNYLQRFTLPTVEEEQKM